MTTAAHLDTVIRHWPDLYAALGTRAPAAWPPPGRMSDYQSSLDRLDPEEAEAAGYRAAAQRGLERAPEQLGHSAAPLRLSLLDVMLPVEQGLVRLADAMAARVQRDPYCAKTAYGWSDAIHQKIALLALQDSADVRRWRRDTAARTAVHAATWLRARALDHPGPFRPVPDDLRRALDAAARSSAERVAAALDIVGRTEQVIRPCPSCGGRIQMTGGAGLPPVARCTGECGGVWTEESTAA